jgi:hypothetical protein
MEFLPLSLQLGLAALLLAFPTSAFATGADIKNILLNEVIRKFYVIVIPITVLVAVIAGFILMVSQDDSKLAAAKKTLIGVGIGAIIMGIFWAYTDLGFIGILYNGSSTGLIDFSGTLSLEAAGISDWVTGMAAMFGILIVIVSVLRAVLSFGADESAYSKTRYAILHVIAGMTIIALAYVFKTVVFHDFQPSALLIQINGWVILLIAVISTIAMAILVYAGLRMVISYGQEEQFNAAKGLALRVIVGLIILALSYALVWIVQQIF